MPTIVDVVHVGIAETVAELMADGAYAVDAGGLQFAAAAIGVDAVAVQSQLLSSLFECPLVGPHRVSAAPVGLALAGIEEKHLVDLAVAVPVVLAEVQFIAEGRTSLNDHLLRVLVVALVVVVAVVASVVGQRDGAVDVEGEVELSLALRLEIVVDGATEAHVVGEVLLVGNLFIELECMCGLEMHIGVFHQDDEPFLLAGVVAVVADAALCHAALAMIGGTGTSDSGAGFQSGHVGGDMAVCCLVEHILPSLFILPVVQVFVAHEQGFHPAAVGQREGGPLSALGGNGRGRYR